MHTQVKETPADRRTWVPMSHTTYHRVARPPGREHSCCALFRSYGMGVRVDILCYQPDVSAAVAAAAVNPPVTPVEACIVEGCRFLGRHIA
jgi:hypothetical protein